MESFKGQYVTVTYDPDHVLTLYIYTQPIGERESEFIGYAHARNMDIQDSSLYDLKQSNKERSTAKREHSNYSAAMALDKRQKLVAERKQGKREPQQAGQKELRGKSKQNSNVVEMRKVRAGKSARNNEPMELLPERVSAEQIKPQTPKSLPPAPTPQSNPTTPQLSREEAMPTTERNRIIIAKNQTLKRIW